MNRHSTSRRNRSTTRRMKFESLEGREMMTASAWTQPRGWSPPDADFDALMDLIVCETTQIDQTVDTQTDGQTMTEPNQPGGADDEGQSSAVDRFGPLLDLIQPAAPTAEEEDRTDAEAEQDLGFDLSLIGHEAQTLQEDLAELLGRLKALQDLQVTVEVRFVSVTDRIFAGIGADFDFEVDADNRDDDELVRRDNEEKDSAVTDKQDGQTRMKFERDPLGILRVLGAAESREPKFKMVGRFSPYLNR